MRNYTSKRKNEEMFLSCPPKVESLPTPLVTVMTYHLQEVTPHYMSYVFSAALNLKIVMK